MSLHELENGFINEVKKLHYQGQFYLANSKLKELIDSKQGVDKYQYPFYGLALLTAGETESAKVYLEACYQQNPNCYETLENLGKTYLLLKENSLANKVMSIAQKMQPNAAPEILRCTAELLYSSKEKERALNLVQLAISEYPEYLQSYETLGRLLLGLEQHLDMARRHLVLALRKFKTANYLYHDLSLLYWKLGKIEKSSLYLKRAKKKGVNKLNPSMVYYEHHFYNGEYVDAWDEYATRIVIDKIFYPIEESLNANSFSDARNLVLVGEQGIGDEIMHLSSFIDLHKKDISITYFGDSRLQGLIERSFPEVIFYPKKDNEWFNEEKIKNAKLFSYLGTYCGLNRGQESDFVPHSGYLKACPNRQHSIIERLKRVSNGRRIIGVTWRSMSAKTRRLRNIPLSNWAFIEKYPEFLFVSLQFGEVEKEVNDFNENTKNQVLVLSDLDLTNNFDAFSALISCCELVIGIDNSTIHLSGALGVKTWVMLPVGHDARWQKSDQSLWYPDVKLMRQEQFNDWAPVLESVSKQLSNI